MLGVRKSKLREHLRTEHTDLSPKLSSYSTYIFLKKQMNEEQKLLDIVLLKHAHKCVHTHPRPPTHTHTHALKISVTWINNNLIFKRLPVTALCSYNFNNNKL